MSQPPFRKHARKLSAALAALGLATGLAAAAEEPIVREIIVRGFPGDPATIKDAMQTREGARLDMIRLSDDLGALLKAGYLATYQVEQVPTGVRILVTVTEAVRVRNVTVKGLGKDWADKVKEEMVTHANDSLSPAILKLPEAERYRGDKERIRAYCQQRGYRAVTVVSQTTQVPNTNQIDLLFTANLGPKYQVKWLRFEGNRGISSSMLREQMQTKRDTLFTSRRYSDALLEDDVVRLQDYYRFKGFPNAKVSYRRRFLGPQGNKVELFIVVQEGQQFPVGQVEAKGNARWSTDTLLKAIPLQAGQVFSDEKLLEAREAVERLYRENGYPYVVVTPTRQLSPAGDAFDVTFTIDEGQAIHINTIRSRGNPRTRRDVILREMELEPGMLYDVRKLERSQRALERLQFFDSAVIKLVPAEPPQAGERDLMVEVTEGRTGFFSLGAGISSENGIIGSIQLTQRNFDWRDSPKSWSDLWSGNAYVGAGQQFRLSLNPGTVYSNYSISYDNPYVQGRNESFGWSLYHRTRDQGDWVETRTGLRLYRGIRKYKGDPDTDVVFHVRLEAVNVAEDKNDDEDDDEEDKLAKDVVDAKGTHPVFGAGVTVRRDRTDRPTFPTKGYEWELGSELVVPHGVAVGAGGTRFWGLGKHPKGYERVVSLKGRVDYEAGSFPVYERLYAGASTLRGFAYRGAGPHQNGDSVGGQFRVLGSAEYRYPIAPPNFYGVFFADTGTVTENFGVFTAPRLALGFGFRLLIPALSPVPIAVDFAAPVIKQGGDDTEFLYFSLSLGR